MIGNPATPGIFAVFVFLWLTQEIRAFAVRPPPALLEWTGRWSYSLYLVHYAVLVALAHVDGSLSPFVRWPLKLAAIVVVSYAFYCVAERPAHKFARFLGQHMTERQGLLPPPAKRPLTDPG